MEFLHIHYKGKTTSPWHVGRRPLSREVREHLSILHSHGRLMWGRGIRGPVLRQLWRAYCPLSDGRDAAAFSPEKDCPKCDQAEECPFNNLRGSPDEGEWKDKPRLIITNLRFSGDAVKRITLNTLSERHLGVVKERAPITVEYIPENTPFEFEVILMAEGARFAGELDSAVRVSMRFLGWGGRCNEGFGRGIIEEADKHSFHEFWEKYVSPQAEGLSGARHVRLEIETLLMLDKDSGERYTSLSPLEKEGFLKKLCNSLSERFWQFTRESRHLDSEIQDIWGDAGPGSIRGWSRKDGREVVFRGLSGEIQLSLKNPLSEELAELLAISRYGIGRYKNQGFGAMRTVIDH